MTTATLDNCIREAVRGVVGADVGPRAGQKAIADNVGSAFEAKGRTIDEGPVGSGKSLAGMVPLLYRAAVYGERGVFFTESLSLLSQIIDKDAPVFTEAVREVTGVDTTVAVLKGFSNYVCPAEAFLAVCQVLAASGQSVEGLAPEGGSHVSGIDASSRCVASAKAALRALSEVEPQETYEVSGREVDGGTLVPLLGWAMEQTASRGDGDRSAYDGDPGNGWDAVSVTTSECPGRAECPFGEVCLPRIAREKCADADVVVTNYHVGAMQTRGASVIFGNRTLGDFDNVVMDEAHALPGIVRSAGAREVSGRIIMAAARAYSKAVLSGPHTKRQMEEAKRLAHYLDKNIVRLAGDSVTDVKVEPEDNPLESIDVVTWARSCVKDLPKASKDPLLASAIRRTKARLEAIADDASAAASAEPGYARWVRPGDHPAFCISPVDVSGLIENTLMTAPVWFGDPNEARAAGSPTKSLGVALMSATIPPAFAVDSGAGVKTSRHLSPFREAYKNSALYIPTPEMGRVARQVGGRWKFDLGLWGQWVQTEIAALVTANSGSALVLSAKSSDGRRYAEHLRRTLRDVRVLSYWDGEDPRRLVDRWREDTNAVLVGTRSLMTGLDAKGDTNTMVLLDRIPRDPSNIVDDARVEALVARGIDKWAAQRMVYGGGASLRLAQALGRLIRSESDSGMFGLLDPRMRSGVPISYGQAQWRMYAEVVNVFGHTLTELPKACEWARQHREWRASRVVDAARLPSDPVHQEDR